MADYWQLEENTDQWQLEENTDLWLLEESGVASGVSEFSQAAPQQADLGIEGWTRGTSLLAQGMVPLFIAAAAQFNPQPAQARIFSPASTPPVVASAVRLVQTREQEYRNSPSVVWRSVVAGSTPYPIELVAGAPQVDPTQVAARLWAPASAPAAAAGQLSPFITGAPEQADLSIEGWVRGTSLLAQGAVPRRISAQPQPDITQASRIWATSATQPVFGAVPPYTLAQPQPDTMQRSVIWQSQPAPFSGTLGAYVVVPQQPDTRQASKVWPAVVTPPAIVTGPVPQPVVTRPQFPFQSRGWIWQPTVDQGPGLSLDIRFGLHALAIHSAEAGKSRIWKSQPAPPSGVLGKFIIAPQQPDTRQASRIWLSQPALFSGVLGAFVVAPPQPDTTQRSVTWKSQSAPFIGELGSFTIVPQQPDTRQASRTWLSQPAPFSGILGQFTTTLPQPDTTQVSVVWQSLPTPPEVPPVDIRIGGAFYEAMTFRRKKFEEEHEEPTTAVRNAILSAIEKQGISVSPSVVKTTITAISATEEEVTVTLPKLTQSQMNAIIAAILAAELL